MTDRLDDLSALARYLADVRAVLDSIRSHGGEDRERAETLSAPLAEIERFIVVATAKLRRQFDAQGSALRTSRDRYRDLVEHLPIAVYVNRHDRIAMANAACAELLGVASVDALIGRDPLDFCDPADHDMVRERRRTLRSGRVALPGALLRLVRADGRRLEVEVAASSFDDGGTLSSHAVLRDVTEQRRADRELRNLAAVLDGVRRVNQLIARASSREELLSRSAEILVEARGLASATFVVEGANGLQVEASAGSCERTGQLSAMLAAGTIPLCVRRAASGERVHVRDPSTECLDCPAAAGARAYAAISVPLACEGRRFGALHVVLPPEVEGTSDEMAILAEVAADVALALRSLELQLQVGRARESLNESEERFRTAFEQSGTGRSLSSATGRIQRVNRSLAQMLGYDPEELVGRDVETLVHPDDQAGCRELGMRLLAGMETDLRFEARYLRKDGSVVWLEIGTALYRDASGTPVQFITDAHDISARKAAEEESAQRGSRLEALAEVARILSSARSEPDVTSVVPRVARLLVDADGANLLVRGDDGWREVAEDSMAQLWKVPRDGGCDGASLWATAHAEQLSAPNVFDDPRFEAQAFKDSFVQSLVITPVGRRAARAAIGVYWATRHAPTPMDLEILQGLASSTWIALENIATWDQLRRSEERYRGLIESLDDVVYAVGVDGRIAYVSGATSHYGFKPEEVRGHRFQDFAHPDDREALERAFAERLAEDAGPYEFRIIDAGGKVRSVRSSGRRVFEEGRFAGLAGVLIDLTTQRSTEEQLRLSQKMEAIGRLAGGVAHDFNNLLTVITSYASLAARGLAEDDPRRGELAEVRKAGERASALTRQLLAFSRRQVLKPDVVDVNALVAGMEKMLTRLIGEDVHLQVARAPNLGRIRADPGQVEQVLMNLAVNARDAMPDGGRLLIETANVDLDAEFVSRHTGASAGPFVRIRVADTGCGMDAATRERLFEPFFTTKPAGKGTGLGLATVYGIVKQSGGSIWVTSEPDQGAVFDAYFPRLDEEPSAAARGEIGFLTSGSGMLLFVEDDEAVRGLASLVLGEAGYEVVVAANGGEALLLAERHRGRIDLVVTDVVMPGMNGKELAERLAPVLRDVPVLFLSGYSHDAIGRHGVLDPGTLFLPKPFTPETLLGKVREILGPGR